jgi:RNA polymerase sigma-70 factor (ECF subfamily)
MHDFGDAVLATAFAAHEDWAFTEAYHRYAGLLYTAAHNVLGKADDAHDCVADAFANLWLSPQGFSVSRGALARFLIVCVRNEAISRRRRLVRADRLTERLATMRTDDEELRVPDPIERERVRRALLTLPVEQRAALELAYYGGRTHREIASELREPLGTIKSRIYLGLRKLESLLLGDSSAKQLGALLPS